jgi:hypothetical protein
VAVGCLASLFNYAAFDIIREIRTLDGWGKAGMALELVVFGGTALILDALFVGVLVNAIGTAFRRLG